MKITPRPLDISEKSDHSRDAVGLNKWARSSRTLNFIMLILGWFTIPAEVLMRRDFGQRWLTVINFYAGFFLLLIFTTVQHVWIRLCNWLQDVLYHIESFFNQYQKPPEYSYSYGLFDDTMIFFLLAYLVMGSYHLFKMWWRNRAGTALHSFDDGTSRFEPIAGVLIKVVNVLAMPFVLLYSRLLPAKQRQGIRLPMLVNDRTEFTNTIFEPFLLLVLAMWFNGIVSLWLYITTIAVAIYSSWKATAKLNKVLDFRDSVIDAKVMMQLKNETEQLSMPALILQQAAEAVKATPETAPQIAEQFPDLMSIIEEMNGADRN